MVHTNGTDDFPYHTYVRKYDGMSTLSKFLTEYTLQNIPCLVQNVLTYSSSMIIPTSWRNYQNIPVPYI
jgi:hypothetical protein